MTDEELLQALVEIDPICEAWCTWCEYRFDQHEPGCPWVLARRRLHMPLGDQKARTQSIEALLERGQIAALLDEVYRPEGAEIWMRSPNPSLGGAVPNELVETAEGRAKVLQVLDQLASGAFG